MKRFLASARASSLSIPVWQTRPGPSFCRRMPRYSSRVIRAHTRLHQERAGIRFLARIIRCGGIVGRRAFSGNGISGWEGFRGRGLSGDENYRVFDNVHSRIFWKTHCNQAWYPNFSTSRRWLEVARNHQSPPLIGDHDFSEF